MTPLTGGQEFHGAAHAADESSWRRKQVKKGALVLEGIKKSFGGVEALRGASLTCDYGEIRALIGENGAGKSTLVKVLAGAIEPDAGKMFLGGERLHLRSPLDAQRAGIATAFQELSLIPDLTVAANLFYGVEPHLRWGRIDKRALQREAVVVFDDLAVEGIDPADSVREISLANRQVLEICKALIRKPKVFVLDEPTAALLPKQVEWLFEKVDALSAEGQIALFISHRLEEIERLCDQVTVFRNGMDVGNGAIKEMPESRLVELMLGRRVERVFPEAAARRAESDVVCEVAHLSSSPRLRDVSLQIHRGEILGVGGLQGQGQLPLFLSLFGARSHTGEIALRGRRLRLRRPSDALESGIVLIPEDRASEGLLMGLGIRDNISVSNLGSISRAGLISSSTERSLFRRAAAQLKIPTRDPRQEVSALSGGNQQKVLLGRALARQPTLLLMYDATRGVDVGTRTEIYRLMRELCEEGVAILFYSTDIFELSSLSDSVIVLHDGAIRSRLVGTDITESRILAASVGGQRESTV